MCATGFGDCLGAIALRQHDVTAAGRLELLDVAVHASGGRRAEGARGVARRGLRRARVVDGVVTQVRRHRLAGVQPLGATSVPASASPTAIAAIIVSLLARPEGLLTVMLLTLLLLKLLEAARHAICVPVPWIEKL